MKRVVSWLLAVSLVSTLLPSVAVGTQTGPQTAPVVETVTQAEPKGEPQAEPQSEPQGEPQSEPQGEPQSEPQSEPQGEPQSEPQGEPQSEPQGEPQSEPRGEPQSEPRGEPQPEPQGEPQPEPQGEPQSEPQGEPQSEPQGEPQSEAQGEPQSEPQGEPQSEAQGEPQGELQPEPQAEPQGEPQSEPQGEPQPEPQGEPQSEPQDEVKDEPQDEVKDEPQDEVKDEPQDEVKGEIKNEPKDEVKNEPASVTGVSQAAAANGAPTRDVQAALESLTITKVDGTVSNYISPGCSFTVAVTPPEGYTVSNVYASLRPSNEGDREHLSDISWWSASGSVFYNSYLTKQDSGFQYSYLKGEQLTVGAEYSLRLEVLLLDESNNWSTSYLLSTVTAEEAPASYLPTGIQGQPASNGVKITWTNPAAADAAHIAYRFQLYNQAGENISNKVIIFSGSELYAMGNETEKRFYVDPAIGPVTVTMETGYFYNENSLPTADDYNPFSQHSNTVLGKTTLEPLTSGADQDKPTVEITQDINASVSLGSSPVTVKAYALDFGTLQEVEFWLQEQVGDTWQDVAGTNTVTSVASPSFNADSRFGLTLSALMDLSGLTAGNTYRLQVRARDKAGNLSDIADGGAFVPTGTVSYPPLGIAAPEPGVNFFTLTLTLSDTAREKILADLASYGDSGVTNDDLTRFLQSENNTWYVALNGSTTYSYSLHGSAGADGALTLRVPLKWYDTSRGTTQSALNDGGISAGKICSFQVWIGSRDSAFSWASKVNSKYFTTLNSAGGTLLADNEAPEIGSAILVDGADEDTFNSTTDTFSVRASDNYLLANDAQFYWREEGTEGWNESTYKFDRYSNTPYQNAPQDSSATYNMKLSYLFPDKGANLVNGKKYEIKVVVSDVGGRTAEVTKTLTYTQAEAPEFTVASLEGKSALEITWHAVEDDPGATYRLYLDGVSYSFGITSDGVEAVEGQTGWYTKTLYLPPAGEPVWQDEEGETYPTNYTVAMSTQYSSGISSAVSDGKPVDLSPDTTAPVVVFYTGSSSNAWATTPQAGSFQVNGSVQDENWEKYARVEVVKQGQSDDDDVLLLTYAARSAGNIEDTPWDFTTLSPYCYYYGDKTYLTSAFGFQFWLNTLDVENPGYGSYNVIIPEALKGNAEALAQYFTAVTDEGTGAAAYTLLDGTYAFRITVEDYAGNRGVSYHPFTVNNVAPELPGDFAYDAQVRMNYPGYSQSTFTWSGAETYPVRLWVPSSGYDTVEARDEAITSFRENLSSPAFRTPQDFLPEDGNSYTSQYSGSSRYYFYAVAICNAAGVAGEVQIGTFDTFFQNAELTVDEVTYTTPQGTEIDIMEDSSTELEQGGTLSVTASGDFFTANSAQSVTANLWHREMGGDTLVSGLYYRFNNSDENGKRTVTIDYPIPTDDFTWSGPQQVYVRLANGSYPYDIRTGDILVNLRIMPDEEAPVLKGVSPAAGAGISGGAFAFTLDATDNSNVIAGAKVWQSPYTGQESWAPITEGVTWDGSVLTLDTTDLTADATGNLKLKFAVTDGAGNESTPISGAYALANSPIAAPTNLTVAAGERQLTLAWNPVQRLDAMGYIIYRAEDSGEYVQVGKVGKDGGNTFTDTDNGGYLDPTKAYSYKVAAYSDANVEGERSVATGWLHPEEQTNAPTILSLQPWQGSAFRSPVTVTAQVEDKITVTAAKLEYAYLGESSAAEPGSGTAWQLIHSFTAAELAAGQSGTTYTLSAQWTLDVAAQTEGWFAIRVTASNNSNKTAVSTVRCRYDNQAPDKVTELTATDEGSGGAIRLNFTASTSPDVQKYAVYRAESSEFNAAQVIGETAAGAYRDSTCEKGKTYYYWVTAVDRAGNESAPTGPVSAAAGAVCDVAVVQPPVSRDIVLTVGQISTIAVTVRNAGPARAGGVLTLTSDYGSGPQIVDRVTFGADTDDDYALLRAGETREVLFTLAVAEGESVTLSATFAIDSGTATDTDAKNNTLSADPLPLNHAPAAVWNLTDAALTCDSGETVALTAEGSGDTDGDALTYIWSIGGESKTGMAVSHRFMTPGSYPVTLTVTDAKGAATVLTGSITVADNRPDLYVDSITVERKGGEEADYTPVTEANPIQEGDAVKVTAVIGNEGAGPVPSDMSFLTSLIRNGTSLGYQTLTGLEAGETKTVTFHYTAEAGAQVLKVVTNDILQVISEPDMANNVMTVQYNADQVKFADIAVSGLTWTNLNAAGSAAFTTQDQVIWSAMVENSGDADATFTLTLYVDGQVAAQRQVFRAMGTSGTESFAITPTAGEHTVTLTAGGELMDRDESNNSATVTTEAFTVAAPTLTLSSITIEPADTADPVQGSTLRFTAQVSSTVNITVPFSVTFQVDGKPLKAVQLDRGPGSNVVLQANQPVNVFAEWVVDDGSHTVTITADPDRAVVEEPVVQTARTLDLTVRKPDLWLSDVYNAPADTLDYGGEAKFTVRVSNRSTATLFDKYALLVSAARWMDEDTEPAENAYETVSRTQYNGIQGNSTSIQILSFRPEDSGKYSVRVSLEPVGGADFDTTYYRPYTFTYTVNDGMTLTTSPNKDGESNDYGANMFLASQVTIPVKASAAMADGQKLTAAGGLSITASILGTDRQVNLTDDGEGNFSADLSTSGLGTQNYTLRFDGVYGGYSTTYETQILFVQDVQGSLSVTDKTTTVHTVESDDPGLQVTAETPITITGTLTEGDGNPYTGTIVLELDLLPSYQTQPDGSIVEGDTSAVTTWYRGQKIIFIDREAADERADITYNTETGTFTYTFAPQAKESGKWVVRAYAYDQLLGTDITSTAFTVYGMEPSPRETVVTMTKGGSVSVDDGVTLELYNAAWDGRFGKLSNVQAALTPKGTYPGITVNADLSGLSTDLPVGDTALSIPVSITSINGEDTPDYAEYAVDFSAVSNDGGSGSVSVSAQAVLKLYLRPATAAPKASPANVVVSANPGDTITRTVTVKNNGMGDWEGITIQQPGLSFIRADNLSKTAIHQWESLTFDVTFAPLASTQLGQYQDKVVLRNGAGDITCTIPVALEVNALDTGTATFQVTSDLGEKVRNAQIKLYGKTPQIQIVNGVETEYYLNYTATTDENGLAVLEGKPAGTYDYVITAQGMEVYEGVLELMPGLSGQAEAVTLTTLPVQITWTVTETTIVDQYDIKLNIDMGVHIPAPKLGSTAPWFTVPKQVDNPITLTTNIVNNSLVDVYDVTAKIDYNGTNPGISVVGGGYIGTIPAMSYKTVQIVVLPGYYELDSRPSAKAALQVTGSYLSYDADGLPELPPKTLALGVGIYNPGTSKVTVEAIIDREQGLKDTLELSLPDGVDVSELEYLLLKGELGEQKPEQSGDGSVMELVKMELSQTASLERQAFDATLTVTNNYTGNTTIQGLTANVVVERVEEDGTVTDATALMYILPQRTAPTVLQPGETATLTWKLIPGEGMGGTSGIKYQVRADVGYTVVMPGEDGTEGSSKPVQTSTQAVEITVTPQPSLTVDYFLPHKVYPGQPFNLDVVVINSGHGPAQNVVLDSSQLEIVENKSGLAGTWQIVGTSFGSTDGSSFRVTLGDVPAGATVMGYYTIRWDLPTSAGELGDDVYGEVLNFTAALTHRPYGGVELNPLITAVYTHVVGKDAVAIQDENQETQTVKVVMGDHGLPAFFWNTATNVRIPLYVPQAVSNGTLASDGYTFTAPERAEPLGTENANARHAVLMIGEVAAMTGIPVAAVYRYDDASMTGNPVELSNGNYWKDTYRNAEGKDTDYLYIVDELRLEDGQVQPRYYKVVYGSGVELQDPVTSQILYDESGERTAVLYETGRNHELGDNVPAQLSVKAVNNSKSEEQVTVSFYAARCVNGIAQEYKYLGSSGPKPLAPDASDSFTYTWVLDVSNPDRPAIAGTYRVKMTTLGADLTAEAAASVPGVTADITFNAPPIADAGVDFSVDYGQPAVFDGTRSYDPDGGAIDLFVWDFGDGQSGFGPTPSHTYRASGSYIATLYVVDDNGTENTMDKGAWKEGRPINSSAVHDVMVTVEETRPDLILPISNGLTIRGGSSFSAGQEVTLHAVITNDESAPVTDNFIATLYVDNVYQGYEPVNLYDNGGDGRLEQGEQVTVDFTYTMPDSYSHVATVKVNDVSLLVDEADLLNNQRSIVIKGSAGVSAFPDLALFDVKLDGTAPDENGVVWASGNGMLSLDAGEPIAITATVKNEGDLDSGATAVILYANGEYAGMAALDALAVGGSQTVTIRYVPGASGSYDFTLLADGPAAKLVELDKINNQVEFSLPMAEILYPDLVVTALSRTAAADGYQLTATVENQGDADCPAGLEVAFYAGGRYAGAAKTGSTLAAGSSTQVTFTWTQVASAETLTAVVNQGGKTLELNQLNNTFTQEEGVSISAPARPTLVVTEVSPSGTVTFGQETTAQVSIQNTGSADAGAFTVSLYLDGALVGSAQCDGLAAGAGTAVAIQWVADQITAGEATLTAVADSQYQVVMDSRGGVAKAVPVAVGRGVLVTLRDPGTLTQNAQNDLAAEVTDSGSGLYTYGAAVTFYLGDQLLGTGTYDEATGTYRLSGDLTDVELGPKTLRAVAAITDESGAYTGQATRTVNVAAPVGITLAASKTVLAAGDTLTLSGTTENVADGAAVTLTLAGCGVYSYTAKVSGGSYSQTIALPADLGGAVTASASVTQNGITRTASQGISVYGAYVSLPNTLAITQGQAKAVTASAVNTGYTDLANLTLKATGVPTGLTVLFRGTGGVYEISGATGISAASLARTEAPVSINGAEPEYEALDFGIQVAVGTAVAPGEYPLTFTLAGATGDPNPGQAFTRTMTVTVTVKEAKADLRIDTGDEDNPGAVVRAIRPGQTVTALVRAWNAGNGALTDLQITAPDLPWVNLAIAGLGEGTTLEPYQASAQRLSIQIVAAPTEKVEAGTYSGTVVISARSGSAAVEQRIPVTFYVSSAQIGTAVLELWDEDSTPVPEGTAVSLYGPAEAAKPQLYTETLGAYGRVQLTNYPAGTYTLTFRQSGFEELEQTFALYPTIDLNPRRVTVERKQFQVTISTDSVTALEGVTGDNQAFYDIIYQLEIQPTNTAGLAFNYPADEFEASYALGRTTSRISVRNSCLEGTGALHETLYDVNFTLLSDDPAYEGLITFRGENGSVSSIDLDELAPGQQMDLVWEVAESALYVRAGVAEAEGSANTYTMTLPEGCGLVWNGEKGMFPTWNSENDGQYILIGVSGDGRTATVLAKTDSEGVTAPAPDSRVPKVQLVNQDGEYIAGGWYLDFTLAASGIRKQDDGTEQPVARTIPLRVSYVSSGYYLAANSAQTALDVRMEAAFPALSGVGYKYFSENFLSNAQISSSQVNGNGFSLGFSHTTAYENETQVLQVRFDNPSALEQITDLTFELMVSDLPPEDGLLAPGGSMKNAAFTVTPSIDGEAAKLNSDGSITVDTVGAGAGVTASFLMTPTLEILDLTILDDFVEDGLMTQEEAQQAAQWMNSLNGDYYAWLNYSYRLNGERYSGSTPAVQQSAKPVAQLASSYSLEAGEGNAWYLNATITNTSAVEAEGVVLMTPSLPVVEGVTVQLLAGTWAFSGEGFQSGWENTPYSGELEVGTIPGGATLRACYKLLVLDGTSGNTPVSFVSDGDTSSGGTEPASFALRTNAVSRAGLTAYEQYRQSLLNMVAKNGVSDSNAYQNISVKTISGDAQASPKELEQIILLLELLNAQPDDPDAETLIEQLAGSSLTSEELKALLTDPDTMDSYGMESLYAVTEEKYVYALSDYLYAVSSLEHWDKQISDMDAWAGNVSLAASITGLVGKLGTAGVKAMSQAYKSGSSFSDMWASTKKAVLDAGREEYVKGFQEYWEFVKKGFGSLRKGQVYLKPYQDLLKLFRNIKAGYTAATSAKGLIGVVERVKQLDRFLPPAKVTPPVLSTKNGDSIFTLLGNSATEYEKAAQACSDALKEYQTAMQNLKDANLLFASEDSAQKLLDTALATRNNLTDKIKYVQEYAEPQLWRKIWSVNLDSNFTRAQQDALLDYTVKLGRQVDRWNDVTLTMDGATGMKDLKVTDSVVKTLSASAKTMREGLDSMGTLMGTVGQVKDLGKCAYSSCVAVMEGDWGQLVREGENGILLLGTNGEGIANSIGGIVLGWLNDLMFQKNAEAAKDSAAGMLTVYQTMSDKVYETLYKKDTPTWPDPDECRTLALTFMETIMGLQASGKEAPSWIKLPTGSEVASYPAELYSRLRAISEAKQDIPVPKPSSKPDIFDDTMYQTIMNFFTHAYVERLMVAVSSGKNPSRVLLDLDLPTDGWVDESILINALTQTQSLMSQRENTSTTLERGIASTEALLKEYTLNATYPTAAMLAYLEELNAYILAAGDDGRSMSGLSPLPVYQRGSGKQITGTLLNFYELRKALAAQNSALSGIYDTTNDSIDYSNRNNWFRASMATADVVSTALSFTSASGFGKLLGGVSGAVSIGYDVYAFFWGNGHQKTAQNAVGVVQSYMPGSMRSLTTLLAQEAQITGNTGDLFGALAQWSKVDPELPVEAISFSVSDAEAAPGQSTGSGQARAAFLNNHSSPVQIHPTILFVSRQGVLTEMPLETMALAAGESGEQTVVFQIPASTLMDAGGYIALLTWSVSEGTTATVTQSSGPITARFWAGEQAMLSGMRDGGAQSTIVASAACREDQATVLTGTVQVTGNTGEARFFLAAQSHCGAELTVTGPDGSAITGNGLTILSIDNEGDYWIITSPEAGLYTAKAVIPAGTSGQASIEALTLTGSGAVLDVHSGDALGIGKDLRGNTASGTLEVILAESGCRSGAGEVTFTLTDQDGNAWSQPGLQWSFFGTEVGDDGFKPAGAAAVKAGDVLAATLLVEPDGTALSDGSYPAWITVTVQPAGGETLQPATSLWTGNDDGSITYRKPITILVDRTPPAEPAEVTAQDQGDGTTLVTGTAQPGQLVGAVLTADAESIGRVEGAAVLAGLATADETTGEFQMTVTTPAGGQLLVPFAASATGTLSLAPAAEMEQPVEKAEVTVTAPAAAGKTYDGTPAQVDASAAGYPGALEYAWRTAGGTALTGAPTDAGSYTVTIRVPESDPKYTSEPVRVTVTIDPAPGSSDPAYREPDGLTGDYGAALGTVALPSGWAWADGTQTLTASSAYQAAYTPQNPNYAPVDVSLTVNVNPPTGKIPVTITGLTVSGKTYDGTAVTVEGAPSVTGGYTGGLTYTWKRDDGTILAGAPADAGSYTLTVSVPEDSEYFGSAVLPFTISKAPAASDPAYQEPAGLTGTAGNALSAVALPGGWSWDSPATVLDKAQDTYSATYTPTNANYESVTKFLTVAVTGDDQSGGGGGGGGGSVPEKPGGETMINPDGSVTTTVTEPDGTVIETTTDPDGTTGTARTDPEGNTTAQVEISQAGVEQAEQAGQPVELPLPALTPGSDGGSAPTVEIGLPDNSGPVTVKIPVEDVTPGVVAVLVDEDGSETVLKQSVPGEGGVLLTLEGSSTIRLVDHTKTFGDVVEDAWYYDAVTFTAARGIFSGTCEGSFSPDSTMTRGMLATVLHSMENNPEPSAKDIFLDVKPDAWYADAVCWVAEKGIVAGYGGGLFGPSDCVTREQLATILWRYAGSQASTHSLDRFTDADQISDYARQAMAWANEHGIISGMDDGRLAPQGSALRSQVAQMLMNLCKHRLK